MSSWAVSSRGGCFRFARALSPESSLSLPLLLLLREDPLLLLLLDPRRRLRERSSLLSLELLPELPESLLEELLPDETSLLSCFRRRFLRLAASSRIC